MTIVSQKTICDVAYTLLAKAATQYPKNYLSKLLRSLRDEESQAGKSVLASILQNILYAAEESSPLCQDTGIPTFHVYLNPSITIHGDLRAALTEATVKATEEVPIRKNVIEPFSLYNSGTNTGWGTPFIHFHHASDPGPMKIRAELKGFGGEIKSAFDWIFTSTENMQDAVLAYVLNNVLLSKGEDCIPGFLGVGVGGYAAEAISNAKNAVYRELSDLTACGAVHAPQAAFEKRLFQSINKLGLGPMGVGGKTTTMGVYLESRGTHTAVNPVAVCHQCWAARGSEALIGEGIQYITPHVQSEEIPALQRELAKASAGITDRGEVYDLQTPVKVEDVLKLRPWDVVYLSGTICTARDGAHGRMADKIKHGKRDEIPREIMEHGVIFHCGPVMAKEQDRWCVHAAGPTTSSRFTDDGAFLVDQGIIRVAIGKGTMGKDMVQALKGKGVYLNAVGGCAVVYRKMIVETGVQWLDLGYPEAVWIFRVNRFGPLVVSIDAHGNSLTDAVMETAHANARKAYQDEGLDSYVRYVQYPQTFAGLSLEEIIARDIKE